MSLRAVAFALSIVPLTFAGCSSGGGSGPATGGVSSGGKGGGGTGGKAGSGGAGGTVCSDNQTCSTPDDCFPISCLCLGMTSSFPVDPICSSGCCLDLKTVCDLACSKDGGSGGTGGTGGEADAGVCDSIEGGAFPIIATDVESTNFAIDSSYVYFGAAHSLKRVPLSGGTPIDFSPGTYTSQVIVDATNMYVISVHEILAIPLAGGTPITLYQSTTSPPAFGLAVDANNLYYKDSQDDALYKVPITGGTPIKLTTGVVGDSLAVDATNVYFPGLGEVDSVPIAGGAKKVLTGANAVDGLAVDGGYVYYGSWASPRVGRVPVAGGTGVELATFPGNKQVRSIAVDATNVYAASADACSIVVRVPKSGGAAVNVADNQGQVRWLAVDATNVYWMSWSKSQLSAQIRRAAK